MFAVSRIAPNPALRPKMENVKVMPQPIVDARENSQKIRVLTADSTRMSSQLLADALAQDSGFEVIPVEASSSALSETIAGNAPHILLLSSTLNGSEAAGFDVARQVHSSFPEIKVIILMDAANPKAVIEAFRSGAQGIFSRTESSKALAKCIRSVHQGQVWANSSELRYLLQALREAPSMRVVDSRGDTILSKREHDVVQCVSEGLSNREIAKRLKLTEHTVKNYLFRIFDKLGVSSRVEVVLYAFSSRSVGHSARSHEPSSKDVAKDSKTGGSAAHAKRPSDAPKELARRARI